MQPSPTLSPSPPPTMHRHQANVDRPLVAGTGSVLAVSVAWSGPLAPLGFSFFLRQVRVGLVDPLLLPGWGCYDFLPRGL